MDNKSHVNKSYCMTVHATNLYVSPLVKIFYRPIPPIRFFIIHLRYILQNMLLYTTILYVFKLDNSLFHCHNIIFILIMTTTKLTNQYNIVYPVYTSHALYRFKGLEHVADREKQIRAQLCVCVCVAVWVSNTQVYITSS